MAAVAEEGAIKAAPFFQRFLPTSLTNGFRPPNNLQQRFFQPQQNQPVPPFYPQQEQQQNQQQVQPGGIEDNLSTWAGIIDTILPFNPLVWVIMIVTILLPVSVLMYNVIPYFYDNSKQTETERIGYAVLCALPIYIVIGYHVNKFIAKTVLTILPFLIVP